MKEEIQQFLKLEDLHQILGVGKNANEEDLKKAYRKLALRYHPDKNDDDGAKEAFKKLSEAYTTLSSPEKKLIYDNQKRKAEPNYQRYHRHFQPNEEFEAFAESLKKQFYQRAQQRKSQHHESAKKNTHKQVNYGRLMNNLVKLIPLLIALYFIAHNFQFFHKQPLYQFKMTSQYSTQRISKNLQVKYFVGNQFRSEKFFGEKLRNFEYDLEKNYITQLKKQCESTNQKQINYEKLKTKSVFHREKSKYQRELDSLDWTSCEMIKNFRQQFDQFDQYF